MIDLHIHILPGIDDGPDTLEEAVAMCRKAAADGCVALVATPHQRKGGWWNTEPDELEQLRGHLQSEIGDLLRLYPGAEVCAEGRLIEELENLPESGILPLAGSRYLLVEFNRQGRGADPLELTHELLLAGWRPVVAHPEFVPQIAGDIGLAGDLVAAGALLQITAMSVTGEFGRRPRRYVRALLDAEMVHFVASDAHGRRWRPPGLSRAREIIANRWGEETARRLTHDNPLAVLQNQEIAAAA